MVKIPIEDIQIVIGSDTTKLQDSFRQAAETMKFFREEFKQKASQAAHSFAQGMGQITSRIGKFNNLYGNFGESLASNFLLFGDAIKSNFGNVAFEDVRDRLKNLSYGLSELRNLSPFTGPAMNLLKQWVFTPLADGFKGLILMLKEGFQEMFTKFEESFSRIKSSNFPSFQMGTSFVPRDTLAYLHRGESVIPAGESQTINFSSPNIYITGTGLDAREIADKIKAFLNDTWARELGSLARR